ncbi:hypothetical protein QLG09_19500 [Enterobacter sp. V89_11]|uniref:DUF4209 domain-containing protein n=1 Tax=Enterobacter sp. V89_11 TaxID=3044237 RepID=UPI00249D8C66|nr:DUF4209 domain-containing protein [Enterobacter sp. V89_11]MDI3451033.1 hypothetical protein [Enterobacter sp. V89_11]
MTDSTNQGRKSENHLDDKTTIDDLHSIQLTSLLEDYEGLCDIDMWLQLNKLASSALERENHSAYKAYRLLATLCSMRMSSDDPADTWHPRWQDAEHRMFTPQNIKNDYNSLLSDIVVDIKNLPLKGRVADIVWTNDRKKYNCGIEAVKAYSNIVREHLNKELPADNYKNLFELINLLQRALYINGMMSKRDRIPPHLTETFERFYYFTHDNCIYVAFSRIGELALGYKIKTFQEVAEDAENLVKRGSIKDYPEARKKVWSLAAKCYQKINNTEGRRRCLEEYSNETLRMCEQVSSYAAQASWVRQAITELQIAGGFQDKIDYLRVRLRDLQLASLSEMVPYEIPCELSEECDETINQFTNIGLPEILYCFAILSKSPSIESLKEQISENDKSGFSILFPTSIHLDQEGKPIAKTSIHASEQDSGNEWLKSNSITHMSSLRYFIAESRIKPARHTTMLQYAVELRHFDAIVSLSCFVPFGHEHLFSLGFARLWQGDFSSAAYILIPQLENTLRHILFCSGRDSFKFTADGLQEDRSLSGLLENKRVDLVEILGEDIVHEIDMLFNYKAGPSLRHKVAHGKLSAGDCYQPDCIYACWFIYRFICLPILPYWKDQVIPQIEMTL